MKPISLIVMCFFLSGVCFSQTAEAFFDRGMEKGERGDCHGAIADYTKAIKLKPYYARAYNRRGFEV